MNESRLINLCRALLGAIIARDLLDEDAVATLIAEAVVELSEAGPPPMGGG